MESKRNLSLDIAKGICLFLVVVSHGCGIPIFGNIIFASYVSAFYVISGYTSKDYMNKSEIIKRFKRLIIPYFIYNLVLMIIYGIYSLIIGNYSIEYMIKGILGILYSRYAIYPLGGNSNVFLFKFFNSPTWFLTSMFITTLLYYFTVKLFKNKKYYAIFGYLIISYILNKLNILLPWSLDTCFFTTSLMLFGNCMKKYQIFDKKFDIKYSISLIIILLSYLLFFRLNGDINLSVRIYGKSILLCFIIGVLGTVIFVSIAKIVNLLKIKEFFNEINKNTTFILCMHFSIMSITEILFPINIGNNIVYYIINFIKITVIIILCIILNKLINKLVIFFRKKNLFNR